MLPSLPDRRGAAVALFRQHRRARYALSPRHSCRNLTLLFRLSSSFVFHSSFPFTDGRPIVHITTRA